MLPAYDAARTLKQTCDVIPHAIVDDIILTDDGSKHSTAGLSRDLGLTSAIDLYQSRFSHLRNISISAH